MLAFMAIVCGASLALALYMLSLIAAKSLRK